ncbi:MAG: hypothetical protein MUC75_07970 [Ignavibacteriaceae bacterium]|jgi:hypothetical protein|nr:hypothetical protein [Ignavibacteriaceae bacterium]
MENDEKKYEEVIKALKGLQEVKAPANFEADLQRRINSEKFSKEEKKSFWQNIFVPAKLIPSLGLVSAAIVIFFVIESRTEEMDNPFLIEPRVREDVFAVTEFEEVEKKQEELSKQKSVKKEEPAIEQRTDEGQLKSSEDKLVSGREKGEGVETLTDEKDMARDQDMLVDNLAVAESSAATVIGTPQPTVPTEAGAEMLTGQSITKEELNFRQIQLTEEEQKAVNELKNQVQSVEKPNKTQK